jgi:hypothetical protein
LARSFTARRVRSARSVCASRRNDARSASSVGRSEAASPARGVRDAGDAAQARRPIGGAETGRAHPYAREACHGVPFAFRAQPRVVDGRHPGAVSVAQNGGQHTRPRRESNRFGEGVGASCGGDRAPLTISLEGTGEMFPSVRGEHAKKAPAKNIVQRFI